MFRRIALALAIFFVASILALLAIVPMLDANSRSLNTRVVVEHTARNFTRSMIHYGPSEIENWFANWEARRNAKHDLAVGLRIVQIHWTDQPPTPFEREQYWAKKIWWKMVPPAQRAEAIAYNSISLPAIVQEFGCVLSGVPPEQLTEYCQTGRPRRKSRTPKFIAS